MTGLGSAVVVMGCGAGSILGPLAAAILTKAYDIQTLIYFFMATAIVQIATCTAMFITSYRHGKQQTIQAAIELAVVEPTKEVHNKLLSQKEDGHSASLD